MKMIVNIMKILHQIMVNNSFKKFIIQNLIIIFTLLLWKFKDSDNEDNKDMNLMGLGSDSNNNAQFKGYSSGKKNRFFWQYNVQAKGPKGEWTTIFVQPNI